jgi:hypothetical protein
MPLKIQKIEGCFIQGDAESAWRKNAMIYKGQAPHMLCRRRRCHRGNPTGSDEEDLVPLARWYLLSKGKVVDRPGSKHRIRREKCQWMEESAPWWKRR